MAQIYQIRYNPHSEFILILRFRLPPSAFPTHSLSDLGLFGSVKGRVGPVAHDYSL
jgi:hypothetical protein